MNIELKLTESQKLELRERADAQGVDPETLVTLAVEALLDGPTETTRLLSGEAWIQRFREWAQSREGVLNPNLDDSRDSIYE